jgi:hypothetical protein
MSRRLLIWTLISNMLILIGVGHGVGPLGIFEVFGLSNPSAFADKLVFSLHETYDHLLLSSLLLTFIGQVGLISTLAFKQPEPKLIVLIISLAFMFVGVLYLSINMQDYSPSMLSFVTSIPFLVLSVISLVRQFRILATLIK